MKNQNQTAAGLMAVSPILSGPAARRRRRRRSGLIAAGVRGLLSLGTRIADTFSGVFGGGLGAAA